MTLQVAVGAPADRRSSDSVVGFEDMEICWDRSSPWISTHDDGVVAVVVDGTLHHSGGEIAAALVHQRYLAAGTAVASGLLGDFVLVILDREARRVLVARDPVGVRPWYLASSGTRHAGASDLATLVSTGWMGADIDEGAVIEHLAAVSRSCGPTVYRHVKTLRPGETWVMQDRTAPVTFTHHDWDLSPDLTTTWEGAAGRCRETIDLAVAERLVTPSTCELSGGLDSSTVVGTAVRLGAESLVAARLVFDSPRADERTYSDAVIDHWALQDVSVPPWIPRLEEAADLTRRIRRPLPDPQFTMFVSLHRTLAQLARLDGLTGLGGDDAFVTARLPNLIVSAVQLKQWSVLSGLVRGYRGRDIWSTVVKPTLHHLAWWRGDRLPPWVRTSAARKAGLDDLFRARPHKVTGIDGIDQRIANLTSGYDAAILESRAVITDLVGRRESHPFLDPRFIGITYGLDPSWPTRGGHLRALEVEAFADRLPPLVRERNWKTEFSDVFWPQLLHDQVLADVRSGPLYQEGWLDVDGFDELVVAARESRPNAAIPLARCVSTDRWLRTL